MVVLASIAYKGMLKRKKKSVTFSFVRVTHEVCLPVALAELPFVLQGTQSLNPHNDYCQHFVDTGHRPQNFIRDVGMS